MLALKILEKMIWTSRQRKGSAEKHLSGKKNRMRRIVQPFIILSRADRDFCLSSDDYSEFVEGTLVLVNNRKEWLKARQRDCW